MSRRCKAGRRARFIKTGNAGRVVMVVRRHMGETVSGGYWVEMLRPWVVTSLGPPLEWCWKASGKAGIPCMTIVADDSHLEPLDDDDGVEDADIRTQVPRTVGADDGEVAPEPQGHKL